MAEVTLPDPAAFEAEVLERLAGLGARLSSRSPELGAAFGALAARLRLFDGGYFSHPLALPVLELPRWAAAHAARSGRPLPEALVVDLGEAAAAGYLHVRVEDDWFDEGVGDPAVVMMLSGALLARHQRLIAERVPGGSAFWAEYEAAWQDYSAAMLHERSLRSSGAPHDAAAYARCLLRSRPLFLPAAAALHAAGLIAAVGPLDRYCERLSHGHQLFADLLHAEKDLAGGATSHVLWRFRGADGLAALRTELILGGGFDAIVAEASAALAEAGAAIEGLDLPDAAAFLAARRGYMAGIQRKVYQSLFSWGGG